MYRALITGLMLLPSFTSSAQVSRLKARCEEDSLSQDQALGRIAWYLRCNPENIRANESATWGVELTQDQATQEYLSEFRVRLEGGQIVPDKGLVAYPLFTNSDYSAIWKAPTSRDDACTSIPAGYSWRANCRASCYKPETELLFTDGFLGIRTARDQKVEQMMVLDESSHWQDFNLTEKPIQSFVTSIKDTWHDIITLNTAGGGSLQVTPNHPLVDGKGIVRTADSFLVGDHLVPYTGGRDEITSIGHERYYGKVYNVRPVSDSTIENIVIAAGYLSGSEWYQNEGFDNQNRRLFRAGLPDDVIE